MCFKTGEDELETVRGMMGMSLSVVVAEVLGADVDEIDPAARLVEDLGMTPDRERLIKEGIAEYFDGLEVDLSVIATLQELLEATTAQSMAA